MLYHKAEELGCVVHAIHVQPEHAHLVLSVPPARSLAMVVGQLKGNSSHGLASLLPPWEEGVWQESYSVFSLGEGDLPDVVRYVRDQDRRHAGGRLWPQYEAVEQDVSARVGPGSDAT